MYKTAASRHFVNLFLLLYSPVGEYKGMSRHIGPITTSDLYCYVHLCKNTNNQYNYINSHPIRTLYTNKIIVSNKLLGLSRLGLGLGLGSGSIYMHEMQFQLLVELSNVVTSNFIGIQGSDRLKFY